MTVNALQQLLDEITQRVDLSNERLQEDTGDGDAVMSARSMFAVVVQQDAPRLIAVVNAVLGVHQLRLYDRWQRVTTDPERAEWAWCEGCHKNVPLAGCPTRQAMTAVAQQSPTGETK